ncbi:hypothetical protein D6C86_01072 [Aureobasidium pullulans]|uniref:Uncharacterized protein n=1 Tax=Aureobasidium pullulans TaxID=5580 RepID=A0A4S9V8T6_AURPU|nr:hypothetical protein D6C94_02328 [Aureobasidium pullulans]THZ48133.1 hypothetical protein D6C87_00995 [Aureobasidium pullulans]THZ66929.1 hypothetical protein D6C86_01072 [Aureobasidium pullulans]
MYASSRQPKNQHFSSTELKPEKVSIDEASIPVTESNSSPPNTRTRPAKVTVYRITCCFRVFSVLLFALCILGGIQAYFLSKVADLHGFSNLVVTETHYFTDTVTATRFLATKVETSTKVVHVAASVAGDGGREEEKDEKEGSKIEFRPIETSNGMNVGGASDALSSSSEHSETTTMSPHQPQGPQPNALNSSSSTESPSIDAITPSPPANYRQLSENPPLRSQPFYKPRQPEPLSPTTQTQSPNTTTTSPTTRRPPFPRIAQFLNKPHHCDEPKTPSTTRTKAQKDSLENCKHVIVTASIVTAAFVICLFVLSLLVAIHLNASTKALNKFNEQTSEAGNGFGVIAEEDVRGVQTVTEVQMVTTTERHTMMDRVEKTVTKVHTVTITEKEKHAVTVTGSGIVSTATELVIFVSDT